MSDTITSEDRARKERSPSFPFIPLGKAIDRARAIAEAHRRSPVRVAMLGEALGYAPKSSGLLQTIAALKAYGLTEDLGRGENRRIRLSDLAWRILHDPREVAREEAIREAAMRPRPIAEYAAKWLPSRPSDHHCLSELHLDRGFSTEAAKLFLRVFDETVLFANLKIRDSLSASSRLEEPVPLRGTGPILTVAAAGHAGGSATALSAPLAISFFGDRLEVRAVLLSQQSVVKLIDALQATKTLLPAEDQGRTHEVTATVSHKGLSPASN
jgi:hypothetical protein